MNINLLNSIGLLLPIIIATSGCAHLQGERRTPSELSSIYNKRDEALNVLLERNQNIVNNLKNLDDNEKNSVIALVTLTKAVTNYEIVAARKDKKLVKEYYQQLNALSPSYAATGKFQTILGACFDQSVSCLQAKKDCLDDGGKEDECDGNPRVVQPCANEAICVINTFVDLDHGIPDILGGRDPWPPQPFPY